MTEHVLECDWNKVCHVHKEVRAEGIIDRTYVAHRDFYRNGQCCQCGIKCECDRLRACEDRVRTSDFYSAISGEHFKRGHAAGLNDAREAVASVEYRPTHLETIIRSIALNAIDALREKP